MDPTNARGKVGVGEGERRGRESPGVVAETVEERVLHERWKNRRNGSRGREDSPCCFVRGEVDGFILGKHMPTRKTGGGSTDRSGSTKHIEPTRCDPSQRVGPRMETCVHAKRDGTKARPCEGLAHRITFRKATVARKDEVDGS